MTHAHTTRYFLLTHQTGTLLSHALDVTSRTVSRLFNFSFSTLSMQQVRNSWNTGKQHTVPRRLFSHRSSSKHSLCM